MYWNLPIKLIWLFLYVNVGINVFGKEGVYKLRIAHNIAALNSITKLQRTNKNVSSAIERLSSGLRINKAADDVAGMAITEKMRAQIRGLSQAQRNIQDGISLVQVADSGLSQIQNPALQRMRELAVQAANGTLTTEDRQAIQKEIDQIKQGINDIANNTTFNGIHLLNVPDTETKVTPVYDSSPTVIEDLTQTAESITIFEVTNGQLNEVTFSIDDLVRTSPTIGVTWSPPNDATKVYYFNVHGPSGVSSIREFNSNSPSNGSSLTNTIAAIRLNGVKGYDQAQVWANYLTSNDPGQVYPEENVLGDNLTDYAGFDPGIALTSIGVMFMARKQIGEIVESTPSNDVILQVGPNSGDTFTVKLTDARTSALGIDDIVVDPPEKAIEVIGKLDAAINKVSSERSKFGSYQNALEHIHNNASNYEVNLTTAESRIADADIAKEIMLMTKEQILSQSTQAMLAHAVQTPEAVLSLLK